MGFGLAAGAAFPVAGPLAPLLQIPATFLHRTAGGLGAVLVLLAAASLHRGTQPVAGPTIPVWRGVIVTVIFSGTAVGYALLLTKLLDTGRPSPLEIVYLVMSPQVALGALVVIGLIGPAAEEAFFRGWLWSALRPHWAALPTACFVSALWLAMHVSPFILLLVLTPVAAILAGSRYLGGSVWCSVIVHSLYNLTVAMAPWIFKALKI